MADKTVTEIQLLPSGLRKLQALKAKADRVKSIVKGEYRPALTGNYNK